MKKRERVEYAADGRLAGASRSEMLRRGFALACMCLLFSPLAMALSLPPEEDRIFQIEAGGDTRILWRGIPIVAADSISYYDGKTFSGLGGKTDLRTNDGWRVFNTWNEDVAWPYRKEVAVSTDGREVELNVCLDVPAYTQKADVEALYSIELPLEPFKGMHYSGSGGRTYAPKQLPGGVLSGETPNGSLLGSSTRYLVFEGGGRKLFFDFNPQGVQTYSGGLTHVKDQWFVAKKEDRLVLSFGTSMGLKGGLINSKLRIFEGAEDDYLNRHAHTKYHYFSRLEPEFEFCFGALEHGDGFIQAGGALYDGARGFGWSREPALESLRPAGALFTAATGEGEASFRCRVPRSGLYILTLRAPGYKTARGPFSISSNGKDVVSGLTVAPHTVKDITWSQWVEDGELELAFSGENWALASLSFQMLQHAKEDFSIRRSYWIADGLFEPNPVYAGYNFSESVQHHAAVSEIPLPEEPVIDLEEAPVLPVGDICLPDQDAPSMRWRYTADLGSLGTDNNGSFMEFDTPELIRRRLTEIKESGVNALVVNGLLARHLHPGQLDRVQGTMKQMVSIAHEMDMKIIDHQDMTLAWNRGAAFRVLCGQIGWTQRTVDGALPTLGFCPANDRFLEQYYDWLIDYILETDLDGMMIDEACFFRSDFCGCADCRRKFTKDTGLVLPMDETSPILQNNSSMLWRVWLKWRDKVIGDFKTGVRKRLAKDKPDFTYLVYTTHRGFSGNSSVQLGGSLPESARACDFLGTEIMSRNVMATYRATYAYRKMKNSLRTAFGSPVFGLVYSMRNADFAYFGWAMNNMNAQVTWDMIGGTGDGSGYAGFQENMDRRLARPVSDVAVFFSIQSRDWPKYVSGISDVVGVSEMLSDRHIMHDFFIEKSITDEFLKKYKIVILPSTGAISRKQIDVFLRYAENGGTLVLSSTAGMLNEFGDDYGIWPFAEPLGLTKDSGVRLADYTEVAFAGQVPVALKDSAVEVDLAGDANPLPAVISTIRTGIRAGQPLVVERPYGKGRIIYSASRLAGICFERESTIDRMWTYELDSVADGYFARLLSRIIEGDSLSFSSVQIPRQVLASVYRQTKDGTTSMIVHLLNASGVKNKAGEKVARSAPDPAWPEITQDLVFEIDLPSSIRCAYAVSPDFEGRKPVNVEPLDRGRYSVTVPKNLLNKYSIIFLEYEGEMNEEAVK